MNKANLNQESERVYKTVERLGRCKFASLCSICQLDNQSIYSALVLLCRQDKVRQEWDDNGVWYSIVENNKGI